ncbi:MAG: hypothetical protein ABIM22_07745 [candidate division WOR-3 bacterium]
MNKITVKIKCEKRENEYLKPFVKFYLHSYFHKVKDVDIDCPDNNNQQKAPDYFLIQPKIAVEIKEVHDREELERSKSIGYNAKRLQEELNRHTKDPDFPKGVYFLKYPYNLKIKKGEEKTVADSIISAIRNNQKNIYIERIGNFEVIRESKGKENKIVLAISTYAVSFNPAETIYKNIVSKITYADKQFETLTAKKKILLLVDKCFWSTWNDETSDFIEALTYSYKDLLNYKNIEEIWLQRDIDGQYLHELLYSRDFLISFDNRKIKPSNKQHKQLFEKWFCSLEKLGDEYKEKLFFALKQFLKGKKPYKVFPHKFTRERMVSLGIWLAEKNRFNDVIWIIDKFINDPDPEEPEKYSGDPKFNYHQQIIEGNDPLVITTVLGHLAWVIQKLAAKKEYISKALVYTEKLLTHKNLYVKLQAIIPLIEIAARRQWLRSDEYKKFRKLVFNLVNLVAKNPNYKAIANQLCNVFAYYEDLSTKEAEQVLDALKITERSAELFVYFGIFRQRHYYKNIDYDGQRLEKRLREMIENREENYQRLRARITLYLREILVENPNEFDTIKPYIDLVLEQPYQSEIYYIIEEIISARIKDKPDVCVQWYKQMLSKVSDFVEGTKKFQLSRLSDPPNKGVLRTFGKSDLGLMHTEEIVEAIAKQNPGELLEVMEKLIFLWKQGVFVGDLKRLFESYKLISDEGWRTKVKKKFQEIKLNPIVKKIEWD